MTSSLSVKIIIFTCDLVLTQILNRIIEKCLTDFSFEVYTSFSDAETISVADGNVLFLIDDLIIGTSSFELISYLRLIKKVSSPVVFFGVNEHGNENKAISIGASYFIKKPFTPETVINLLTSLQK